MLLSNRVGYGFVRQHRETFHFQVNAFRRQNGVQQGGNMARCRFHRLLDRLEECQIGRKRRFNTRGG